MTTDVPKDNNNSTSKMTLAHCLMLFVSQLLPVYTSIAHFEVTRPFLEATLIFAFPSSNSQYLYQDSKLLAHIVYLSTYFDEPD